MKIECDSAFAMTVGKGVVGVTLSDVPGSGSQTAPYQLDVTPLGMLLAIGRATAAAANPSLQRFLTGGLWAVPRWYWTLDAGPPITLTQLSNDIRHHHRQAFSEALGLGAGLLIGEHLMAGGTLGVPAGVVIPGAPVIIDVDTLVNHDGLRPDLVILPPPNAGSASALILECKGGSSSRSATIDQLRTGVDQTLALPGPARRLVVGAYAPRTAFNVFAVEVPTAGAGVPASGGRDLGWDVPAEQLWLREAERMLRFAGLDAWSATPTPSTARHDDLEITGTTFRLRRGDERVDVTAGLVTEVADSLRSGEVPEARLRAAREVSETAWRQRRDERAAPADRRRPETVVRETDDGALALALDGCGIVVKPLRG